MVCGVGREWVSGRRQRCGGGVSNLTHLALDRVCEKHVLVINGRVYERGFTVNPAGMSLILSRAIPWVGRAFVLGFGRVVRERPANPWTAIRPTAEHFPAGSPGFACGYHPYEVATMSTNDAGTTAYASESAHARNGYVGGMVAHRFSWDAGPAHGTTQSAFATLGQTWGRASPYAAIGLYAVGNAAIGRYRGGICRLDVSSLMVDRRPLLEAEAASVRALPIGMLCISGGDNLYLPNMLPDAAGNLWLAPRRKGLPFLKLPAPDYDEIINPGPDAADPESAYIDPFNPATRGSLTFAPATGEFSTCVRLFDGRFLAYPNNDLSTAAADKFLTLFDPATAAVTRIPVVPSQYIIDGGNSNWQVSGNTRWRQPVQAANGKVYALPGTFPGNLTLIFDPIGLTAEVHDMGIASANAALEVTDGVPCADGRIYYLQTYGAATDVRKLLVLDVDGSSSLVDDLGMSGALLANLCTSLALSDGCPMFMGPAGATGTGATSQFTDRYNRLIYDPWRNDYVLHRKRNDYLAGEEEMDSLHWFGYSDNAHGVFGGTSTSNYPRRTNRDDTGSHWRTARFLTPEYAYLVVNTSTVAANGPGVNLSSVLARPPADCWYFEAPSQVFPGSYCRQAFFGRCL
jgi:hypothetical protein